MMNKVIWKSMKWKTACALSSIVRHENESRIAKKTKKSSSRNNKNNNNSKRRKGSTIWWPVNVTMPYKTLPIHFKLIPNSLCSFCLRKIPFVCSSIERWLSMLVFQRLRYFGCCSCCCVFVLFLLRSYCLLISYCSTVQRNKLLLLSNIIFEL